MSEPRKLPGQAERVETGVVQFGDDWPGVFIRGDNAAHYAHMLEGAMNGALPEEQQYGLLEELLRLFSEARV